MNDENDKLNGTTSLGDNAKGNAIFRGDVKQDFVQGDKNVYEAPKPGLAALHQLEPPPVDFVGREAELTELLVMVKQGGVTISGLQGLGGVGKTTLALKLASLLKADYPDAQFFLDLKGPEPNPLPATEALKHVIHAYHPMAILPESLTELRVLYLSLLEGQRVLLLMDNARDETQIKPLLPPAGCLLLVTSRFHFTVPGLRVKSLDALPPEDAVKLLLEIAPHIGDQATEITRLCGNLPLGLRLAGSFVIQRRNFKVAKLVGKLSENREWIVPIEASLSLSYELLREELQANWRALAVFPDSFDQRAATAVWELSDDHTQERLGELLNFSLVEWSEATDRYRLHDLARVFANSRLTEAERLTYPQRHAEHFLRVLMEADNLYKQGGEAIKGGLALFDQEWGNVQGAWAWVRAAADAVPRALELCSEYPDASTFIAYGRQHPRECIVWREVALAAAQKLGRKDEQSWHLSNLGIAYWGLGQPKRAIEFYEQSLAVTREVGDRRSEGNMLNNLGNAYKDLGEPKRAIEFYEQSLAVKREIGDRRVEGQTLNNLGNAYTDLGKTKRAIELYEQSLAIRREVGDRRGEGATLWNTALALNKLGDRTQALALGETALAVLEQSESPVAVIVHEILAEWRGEGGAANE